METCVIELLCIPVAVIAVTLYVVVAGIDMSDNECE